MKSHFTSMIAGAVAALTLSAALAGTETQGGSLMIVPDLTVTQVELSSRTPRGGETLRVQLTVKSRKELKFPVENCFGSMSGSGNIRIAFDHCDVRSISGSEYELILSKKFPVDFASQELNVPEIYLNYGLHRSGSQLKRPESDLLGFVPNARFRVIGNDHLPKLKVVGFEARNLQGEQISTIQKNVPFLLVATLSSEAPLVESDLKRNFFYFGEALVHTKVRQVKTEFEKGVAKVFFELEVYETGDYDHTVENILKSGIIYFTNEYGQMVGVASDAHLKLVD